MVNIVKVIIPVSFYARVRVGELMVSYVKFLKKCCFRCIFVVMFPTLVTNWVDITNWNCLDLILSERITKMFCFDTHSCSEWVSPSGVESYSGISC